MILPAALPAATVSPAAPLSGETPEIGAEFAALLEMMLEAVPAEHPTAPTADTTPTPIGKPMPGNPLPDELPPFPAAPDTEAPETDVLNAILAPLPVAALAPIAQPTPSAEGTAETPGTAPQHAVAIRQTPVQLAEGHKVESTSPSRPKQPRAEQAPTAAVALPRLALSNADETVPPASPAPARIVSAPLERGPAPSPAAPTPTVPQLTFAVAEATANSPPATAPNPIRPQATHDFATLVDRLVEARDTARAVQAPQTVSASLAHAQFGDIAIRFEHGGTALSVAFSNPDPEFARAVQAAAPAAQANDGGQAPQRQDASGQQTSGSSGQSSQSQAQQRGTGPAARGGPQEHGRDEQPGRSGIFA